MTLLPRLPKSPLPPLLVLPLLPRLPKSPLPPLMVRLLRLPKFPLPLLMDLLLRLPKSPPKLLLLLILLLFLYPVSLILPPLFGSLVAGVANELSPPLLLRLYLPKSGISAANLGRNR